MYSGDKVILSELGVWRYKDGPSDPHNTIGEVGYTYEEGECEFCVKWANGETNVYYPEDLELVK